VKQGGIAKTLALVSNVNDGGYFFYKKMGFERERLIIDQSPTLLADIQCRREIEVMSPEEEELRILSKIYGKVNAFGTNQQDEFQIDREGGEKQGIFKTWAVPIIPFIDAQRLDVIEGIWTPIIESTKKGLTFEESLQNMIDSEVTSLSALAQEATEIMESWTKKCLDNPRYFQETIEKNRVFSVLMDRRLSEIFGEENLSENIGTKISQLVARLEISSGLLSPFYNIEAMLGDTKGFIWNPIRVAENEMESSEIITGGKLDTYALLLPAAMKEYVLATDLNWNNLDWNELKKMAKEIMTKPVESRILSEIIELTGHDAYQILFALNAMQWIPTRVAGKKDDFSTEDALSYLECLIDKKPNNKNEELIRIGKDMNALIRFLNWFPLVEGEENFIRGVNWSYASVCDTASQLLRLLDDHPEVWKEDFKNVFVENLRPQLQSIDATSAIGKFLLELITLEKKIKPELGVVSDNEEKNRIMERLLQMKRQEKTRVLGLGTNPRCLIGGKVFGLEDLINNLPVEVNVPSGIVVTSEAVEDLLKNNSELWNYIVRLNQSEDLIEKKLIGEEIIKRIKTITVDPELLIQINSQIESWDKKLAIRSSSFDEDNGNGQTAAGIYESVINVEKKDIEMAIKETISSFFSEKALCFRNLIGSSDIPKFSLLIQPMVDGIGGVVFSQGERIIIEVAESADGVTSGEKEASRYEITENGELQKLSGIINVDKKTLSEIKKIVSRIRNSKRTDVDIEWAIDEQKKLWILQVRNLPKTIDSLAEKTISFTEELKSPEDLTALSQKLSALPGSGVLVLRGKKWDLDAFQGFLFTSIAKHGDKIAEIWTEENILLTSHFANICNSLGIKIKTIS